MGYTRPIVALTANALIGHAEELMKKGFDGFLSKPVQTVHLNGVLGKYVRDIQPPEVIEEAKKSAAQSEKSREGINDFLEREMNKLRKDFYNGQRHTAKNIREALAANDYKTAERHAHTLKGLAGLIKEDHLAHTARQVEEAFKNNETPAAKLETLEKQLKATVDDIEKSVNRNAKAIPESTLSPEERTAVFDNLQKMLANSDAACLQLAEELAKIPETTVLAKQIENCNFEDALATLNTMRTVLEV
jgi:HPt (histidine-containing phosphotransfer) domain-containing protein